MLLFCPEKLFFLQDGLGADRGVEVEEEQLQAQVNIVSYFSNYHHSFAQGAVGGRAKRANQERQRKVSASSTFTFFQMIH